MRGLDQLVCEVLLHARSITLTLPTDTSLHHVLYHICARSPFHVYNILQFTKVFSIQYLLTFTPLWRSLHCCPRWPCAARGYKHHLYADDIQGCIFSSDLFLKTRCREPTACCSPHAHPIGNSNLVCPTLHFWFFPQTSFSFWLLHPSKQNPILQISQVQNLEAIPHSTCKPSINPMVSICEMFSESSHQLLHQHPNSNHSLLSPGCLLYLLLPLYIVCSPHRSCPKSEPVTPLLKSLLWLPSPIEEKLHPHQVYQDVSYITWTIYFPSPLFSLIRFSSFPNT